MRPRTDWKTLAGGLAVLASLCLASPGVRVVRAGEVPQSQAPVAPDAATCSAQADTRQLEAYEAWMADMRRRAAAEIAAGAAGPRGDVPIPLNNRGYNSGPPPGAELGAVLREDLATR